MKTTTIFLLLISLSVNAQQEKFSISEIAINSLINGTLYTPSNASAKTDLVIIIAGSGPTDRNGNQPGLENNSLRFLAQGLANNDIAAFPYDKRIIAAAKSGKISEKDLSFDDFINDAKAVVSYFKEKKQFRRIIIAGHSEGSLIGMVAANANADAFISIAGPGRTIDLVLEEQLAKQLPEKSAEIHNYLQKLKKGETFEVNDQTMGRLFRPSVQPYLISWIKYDPTVEIAKLKIPVLLINGNRDIQVSVADAELLHKAKPDAKLEIITNMNHIFKEVKTDDVSENRAAFTSKDMPIKPELITSVNQFIKSL